MAFPPPVLLRCFGLPLPLPGEQWCNPSGPGCRDASLQTPPCLLVGGSGVGCSIPGGLRDSLSLRARCPQGDPTAAGSITVPTPRPREVAASVHGGSRETGRLQAALPGCGEEPAASKLRLAGDGGGETRMGWGMHPQHLHEGQTGRESPFTQHIQPTDGPMGQTPAHGTYCSPGGMYPSPGGAGAIPSKCLAPGALLRLPWHKGGSMFKRHSCP